MLLSLLSFAEVTFKSAIFEVVTASSAIPEALDKSNSITTCICGTCHSTPVASVKVSVAPSATTSSCPDTDTVLNVCYCS